MPEHEDQQPIKHVIGFDLGDGESCLSLASSQGTEHPTPLDLGLGGRSFITAIGTDAQGKAVVGDSAFTISGVEGTRITFKRAPSRDDGSSQSLARDFFSAVAMRVSEKGYATPDDALYVVGHPSNWSVQDRTRYTDLLANPNAPRVTTISESRAAFLQLKEEGKLTPAQLRSVALIVDIGSSTTDFTLVKHLHQQPIEFGHNNLGGRLLDRQLLEQAIEMHAQGKQIRDVFAAQPHRYAEWERQARLLKEWYFNNEVEHRKTKAQKKYIEEVDLQGTVLRVPIDADIADALVEKPIEVLGKQSWKSAFESILRSIRKTLERDKLLPATIAMTGGASKMEFTQKLCRAVFPESKLVIDAAPEFCIANGLARAGRWDLRSERFQDEVEAIVDGLPGRLTEAQSVFIDEVVPLLANGLAENVVRQGLLDWREGRVRRLSEMDSHMKQLAEGWIQSSEARALYHQPIKDWLKTVVNDLRPELAKLCHRYGLADDQLDLDFDKIGLEKIDPSNPNVDDPEGLQVIGNVVAGITFVIVAKITTAILVKIHLASGPFALVVAGVVAFLGALLGALIGKEAAQDIVKSWDLPNITRGMLLWDSSIEKAVNKARDDFATGMRGEIEKLVSSDGADLLQQVSEMLMQCLQTKMEQALVLIRG